MAATTTKKSNAKTETKTEKFNPLPENAKAATKALESARVAVSEATHEGASIGDDWETVAGGGEAEGFLKEEDLPPGAIVQGEVEDARLIADTDKGGYRVVYAFRLELDVGRYDAGSLVLFGEKHKMRALRSLPLGSKVRVEIGEKVKLKGGRSMVAMDIKTKRSLNAKSFQAHLTDTFKSMGLAADEWNRIDAAASSEASPF